MTSSVRIIFRNKLPTNSFYLGEVKLHIGVVKYPSRPIVGNLVSFSLHGSNKQHRRVPSAPDHRVIIALYSGLIKRDYGEYAIIQISMLRMI